MRNVVLFTISFFLFTVLNSCKKSSECNGSSNNPIPISPYTNPVWHPDGKILGFNHQAVKNIVVVNTNCSLYYSSTFYSDSSGFWLINRDGTDMRMVTTFQLLDPAWSPDGKWIAFCNGGHIYKMAFDGIRFDTSHLVALTNSDANDFYPSWNSTGDIIYYQSNRDAISSIYYYAIWKMRADGNAQVRVTDTTNSNGEVRHPFLTPDDRIIHFRYPTGSQEEQVFIMDAKGDNVNQVTNNPNDFPYTYNIGYFNNKIYFESKDLWNVSVNGLNMQKIVTNSTQGFSIASDGEIAYVNFSYENNVIDKTHGTIWLTDADGKNPKPLTYNN